MAANRGDVANLEITAVSGGSRLRVRAKPGARRCAVEGEHGGALRVAVSAPPEKGRANDEIEAVVAAALGVARARVRLLSGHASRAKSLAIEGLSADEVRSRLAPLFAARSL